jgi:hypothetical protein
LCNNHGEFQENIEMIRRVSNLLKMTAAALALCVIPINTVTADVINIDTSAVDPSALPAVREAEAIWEARIQAYSTELPRAIRDQLGSILISATVAPVDGVGGILGFAGPDAVITISNSNRAFAVAVRSSMTFDLDDFPSLEADGILVSVIAHEMGHALGFGTLFAGNGLIGPLGGFGQTEYINGDYALAGFRLETNNPVATFVPLEQRGGPGTALGHWNDFPPFFNQVFTPAFTKELMTGFACDFDPVSQTLVCAPTFVSQATFGAMADLGYAVQGINGAFAAPRGLGTGRWPKIIGSTTDPFALNGVPPAPGLGFSQPNFKALVVESMGSTGSGVGEVDTDFIDDPFSLRRHSWAK